MWSRVELKSNAKEVLRRTYWLALAVCLIAGILGEVGMMPDTITLMQSMTGFSIADSVMWSITGIGFIYTVLIGNVLSVGLADFFMTSRQYDTSFGKIFSGFSKNYFNVIKTLFLRGIYVALWSLLLVIPGIVKSYEYFFLPYILAENPDISSSRAFEISREMTRGKKLDIFLLQLSFLGWLLLGVMLCGVGTIFVTPYMEATNAELYAASRADVLNRGIVAEEELCGFYEEKNFNQ